MGLIFAHSVTFIVINFRDHTAPVAKNTADLTLQKTVDGYKVPFADR
jgi:hypothetical protein